MCGIVGVVEGGDLVVPRDEFLSGLHAIRHRGPDDHGVWNEDGVTLGHARLSIVDLSPTGHQPMLSSCGRYIITYNGEIYNYGALRAELDAPSQRPWRGTSDTEVLVELIAAQGIETALEKVNGMFAFGLWDRRERRLFLARDRFGEKPLFYAHRGQGFVFASELAAIEPIRALNLRVRIDSVAQYFQCGYVPTPQSIYEGVLKLPPGALLSWKAGDAPRVSTYWSVEEAAREAAEAPRRPRTMAAAVEELDALIQASTAARMVADVPVGVFLSGGVDSSVVAAAMQKCASRPITTLTLGFDDPRYNEADHARAVAAHLGTNHIEEVATASNALAVVDRLGRMYDEPLADPSQIPTYLLSEMARKHVTVALSGDGGDEMFAGYRRHFATPALWRRIRAVPMRGALQAAIAALPEPVMDVGLGFLQDFSTRYGNGEPVGRTMKRVGSWLDADSLLDLHERTLEKWPRREPVVHGGSERAFATRALGSDHEVDQLCLHDMRHYLPGDILTKVDRASMAVSLETRIPLLDPGIAKFALGLPPEFRLQGTTGKVILREVLKRHVPESLFNRPKAGFAPPLKAWLLGPLRGWAEDLLSPAQLSRHGILNVARVRAFWERYKQGGSLDDQRAWAVLQFQSWMVARGY
ncbi:MAG: asparagine synthase (glutamine-hydrolyzing) [Hyphomonadaceae bacterium]|nr:asparagine synthase (glutamine-hydrolyzing) [Hyphomonadaceae bacterium]